MKKQKAPENSRGLLAYTHILRLSRKTVRIAQKLARMLSFLVRTIPSVKESHLVGTAKAVFADFTAGVELHHAPKIIYDLVLHHMM